MTVEQFWAQFTAETGIEGSYTTSYFGDSPELQTELALLVRDGPKRATAGLLAEYQQEQEPLPEPGDLTVIVDGAGEPVCVIRTSAVEIRPFGEVDAEFAFVEGEGDRSLEYWREAHTRFFAAIGSPVDETSEVVMERFDLLWPAA